MNDAGGADARHTAIWRGAGDGGLLAIAQFLIGFGLGPLIVGALSDTVEPLLGVVAIRYAMLLAPIAVSGALIFLLAAYRGMGRREG